MGISISVSPIVDETALSRLPAPQRLAGGTADTNAQLHELFASCGGRIGKYLAQMVGDRYLAKDLLQDTFHDAVRALTSSWTYDIRRRGYLASPGIAPSSR